jgi:large subunit ribosomal protein L18
MRLKIRKKSSPRLNARLTKKVRIRKKLLGTAERPRLCVFRSAKHIYGQVVDDNSGKCLLSVSSTSLETDKSGIELCKLVGAELAKKAKAQGISSVVFDRNGFIYHGRIKSFADAVRENGLSF